MGGNITIHINVSPHTKTPQGDVFLCKILLFIPTPAGYNSPIVEHREEIQMPQSTARQIDNNGFMTVRGCPLSREGIYEYSAKQIGLDGDPNRIVKVYRPDDAVRDPEAINSFKSVPLINEHEMLNGIGGTHPEYTAPEEKGIDGVLTDNVYYDESDGWMKGDIKVFTRSMFDALNRNKDDLSLGFGCLFYLEPGVWNGQEYEVVQRRMRGNHLAVVDDGRIEGARVLDAMCFDSLNFHLNPNEDYDMAKGIPTRRVIKGSAADSALEKLKVLVPALQAIIAEGQAETGGNAQVDTDVPAADPAAASPVATADEPNGDEPPAEPAAAAPAEAPAAAPEAAAPASPDGEPAADPAQKPEDVQVVVQQVEALLAQLKDMLAPAADPAVADPAACADTVEPEQEMVADDVTGAMAATDTVDPAMKPVGDQEPAEPTRAMDENSSAGLPTGSLTTEASAQDAALGRFYADQEKKSKLYNRVSHVIGAFECAAMDSKAVAVYAAKKLGIACTQDQAYSSVDVYLNGLAKGQKSASEKAAIERSAMDARSAAPELDAWLNEAK